MRRWSRAALGLLAIATTAPAADDGVARAIQAALDASHPRDARAAAIAALQHDPGDGRLHLLRAKAETALRDGETAEAEVDQARAHGVSVADTRVAMAEALLLQGEGDAALAEVDGPVVPAALRIPALRARARAQAATGDTDAAAATFAAARASAPGDPLLLVDLARFRLDQGDDAGALEAADRAVASGPKLVPALVLRGDLARAQYGLAAAMAWYDRALAIEPRDVPALIARASTAGDMGAARRMLADARAVLALDPRNAAAFYFQAVLAARAGRFELARGLMARTGGQMDQLPGAMLLGGIVALETGSPEQAIGRLRRLVADQPDNMKARRVLALAQWRSGDADAVAETLRPLADAGSADSWTLILLGRALERQGDRLGAATYLDAAALGRGVPARGPDADTLGALYRAARAAPGDADARIGLIRGLLDDHRAADALAEAADLRARYPGAADAQLLVGDALLALGRARDAADAYRLAANIGFSEPVALRLIAALRQAGDGIAAQKVLRLFVAQNPETIPGRLLLADLLMHAGRWDRLVPLLDGLRRDLGEHDAALLANLGWGLVRQGRTADGLALAARAHALAPANVSVLHSYGWMLAKAGGDVPRGRALLAQAAREAPADAAIARHLKMLTPT